ncbi:MAG: hypothetical protein OHK0029_43080 [Armatimonadaceae bacterium]
MQVTLADLEPELARRIKGAIQQSLQELNKPQVTIEKNRLPLYEAIRQRHTAAKGLNSLIIATAVLLLVLLNAFSWFVGRMAVIEKLVLFAVLLLIGAGAVPLYRNYLMRRDEKKLVLLALPFAVRNKAEQNYLDLLVELEQTSAENDATARTLLQELNTLIAHYRTLETCADDCYKAMNNRSVTGLKAELRDLEKRAAEATDPATRQALEQSVELCESRLESVSALTVARERALAQQEVILQTLGSVHALFARIRTAPQNTHSETQQLSATVSELHNRTRAVEQAVEELATVSVKG